MLIATNPEEFAARLRPIWGNVAIDSRNKQGLDVRLATSLAGGAVTHKIQTTTGVQFRSDRQFDGYALVLLQEGGMRVRIGQQERAWSAGACAVLDATQVNQWQWEAGSYDMLLVGAGDITQRLSTLLEAPVTRPVIFQTEVSPDLEGVKLSRALMQLMQSCFGDNSGMTAMATAASIRDVAVGVFLEALPHNYSDRLLGKPAGPSPRHIRTAITFIHANARSRIFVEDIAGAAGVSVRALQLGFTTFKSITPMAYLKRVRLEGVRNELLHSEHTSVAEVATSWGFMQLGTFAKVYREAFGELPSQTRRMMRR